MKQSNFPKILRQRYFRLCGKIFPAQEVQALKPFLPLVWRKGLCLLEVPVISASKKMAAKRETIIATVTETAVPQRAGVNEISTDDSDEKKFVEVVEMCEDT